MASVEIAAARCAEVVRQRLGSSPFDISAYWLQMAEGREAYAEELRDALHQDRVAVLIVRTRRFDNPNAVLMDLVELLEEGRTLCESSLCGGGSERCGLVLLGRDSLMVGQAASPVTLPEWFPLRGGQTVYTQIVDLTWTADAPLNGEEARIEELSERIFAVEGELLARLAEVDARDGRAGAALFDDLRRENDAKYGAMLVHWREFHDAVRNPSSFRPSVATGNSFAARLWGVMQKTSPDRLARLSKHMGLALDLEGIVHDAGPLEYEPLVAVLARPQGEEKPRPDEVLARSLLVVIATGFRLITAAKHADASGRYPVALIRSLSLDLRRALECAEALLAAGTAK